MEEEEQFRVLGEESVPPYTLFTKNLPKELLEYLTSKSNPRKISISFNPNGKNELRVDERIFPFEATAEELVHDSYCQEGSDWQKAGAIRKKLFFTKELNTKYQNEIKQATIDEEKKRREKKTIFIETRKPDQVRSDKAAKAAANLLNNSKSPIKKKEKKGAITSLARKKTAPQAVRVSAPEQSTTASVSSNIPVVVTENKPAVEDPPVGMKTAQDPATAAIRKQFIHMLAVAPLTNARVQSIPRKIITDVAVFEAPGKYRLLQDAYLEVDINWPSYTEEDRQKVRQNYFKACGKEIQTKETIQTNEQGKSTEITTPELPKTETPSQKNVKPTSKLRISKKEKLDKSKVQNPVDEDTSMEVEPTRDSEKPKIIIDAGSSLTFRIPKEKLKALSAKRKAQAADAAEQKKLKTEGDQNSTILQNNSKEISSEPTTLKEEPKINEQNPKQHKTLKEKTRQAKEAQKTKVGKEDKRGKNNNSLPISKASSKVLTELNNIHFEEKLSPRTEFDEKYKEYTQLRIKIEEKQKLFSNLGELWKQSTEHEKEALNKQIVALYSEHKQKVQEMVTRHDALHQELKQIKQRMSESNGKVKPSS